MVQRQLDPSVTRCPLSWALLGDMGALLRIIRIVIAMSIRLRVGAKDGTKMELPDALTVGIILGVVITIYV